MIYLLKVLILLTIFLTPLVFNNLGFEQAKVLFFIQMTSVSGFLWLILIEQKKINLKLTKIRWATLLFILLLLISSLLGLSPRISILGNQLYIQGFILYVYLCLFFLIISSVKIPLSQIAAVLSLSATVVSLVAIKEWIFINIMGTYVPNYAGRVVSTFGQPNFYSGFVLLTIPFCVFLLGKKRFRKFQLWLVTSLVVLIIAAVLSYSKTSILILSAVLFILLLYKLKTRKILVYLSLIFLTVIVIISFKINSGLVWQEISQPNGSEWLIHNSPEKRIFIWPVIFDLVSKRPFLGYGLENIDTAFVTYERFHEQRSPAYYGIKNLFVDRSHNYLLDLLMFSGILGTVAWIFMVALMFKKAKGVLLMSLVVYLAWIQLQNQSIVHLLYFWQLAGLIDQEA